MRLFQKMNFPVTGWGDFCKSGGFPTSDDSAGGNAEVSRRGTGRRSGISAKHLVKSGQNVRKDAQYRVMCAKMVKKSAENDAGVGEI